MELNDWYFAGGTETRVNAVRVVAEVEAARSISGPEPEEYTFFELVFAANGSFHIPLGAGTYQLTVVSDEVELAVSLAIVETAAGTYVEIGIIAP